MRWYRRAPEAMRPIACVAILAAGLAGGVFVSGAAAQTSADFVARMDKDIDGRVSLAEFTEHMSYAFRRMDADGNGLAVGIWAREHQVVEDNVIANGPGDSSAVSYGVWNGLVCRDNTVFGYPTAYENCAVVIGGAP